MLRNVWAIIQWKKIRNVSYKDKKQSFADVLQNRFLKVLQISQENTCVGVSFQ